MNGYTHMELLFSILYTNLFELIRKFFFLIIQEWYICMYVPVFPPVRYLPYLFIHGLFTPSTTI